MWVNLTFVVVLMLAALSQLQGRNDCPFRYPDMYFDYRGCSTVLDWSRAIDGGCQDSYEVQFIDEDCNMRTFNTTEKDLFAGEYPPGRCLADDNCYARVGAQGRENLPTRYSTWTGLSHTSQMFHACVVEGNDVCLPLQFCSGTLPIYLINGNVSLPRPANNIVIENNKICLKRITNHMHYLEICHQARSLCSSNDEFIIFKRGQIEVTTDACSSDCYNQCGLEANSAFAQKNHCVVIDWKMFDSTSDTLRNVCISTEQNQSSIMMLYSLQLLSSSGLATQPDCDEYSDINTHSEIYSFSSAERGERSIMICSDSQPPQNHRLLANSSDIGTTRCPPTNASGPGINTIIIIIISIMVIIVII